MVERPAHLLCNGRPADQQFDDDEALFRRFVAAQKVEGKFVAGAFRVPDLSVYRNRYCVAEDAKIDAPNTGVLQFLVGQIPPTMLSGDNTEYQIKPVHDPVGPDQPEPEHYAHTEIRAHKNDQHRIKNWPKTVETAFKLLLTRVSVEVISAP